ncbi:MAG: efflux RND transporter permease subunit [Deltaproteobacteria bacterium]|nr:efflux RND transporter permease subunit [Deltaproteobacteria bacterium]
MSLVPVVFGLVSLMALGVREYPAVDPPVVTVSTTYSGAAPEVIDAAITEPLERTINSVPGIRTLSSSSGEGRSDIRVEFDLGVDIDAAANDIRDKVAIARRLLPQDADAPVVEKADADSAPVIFMTLRSDKRTTLELSDYADTLVKDRIQTIAGVSAVRIFGEKRFAMRLELDPARMAQHGVTPDDIAAALARENIELPAGRIEGAQTEMGIRADARLERPEEFDAMIIRGGSADVRAVRLRDVGRAVLGPENLRTGIKNLGAPMVGVAVIPQASSNAVAIADEFYVRLESIKRAMPPDVTVDIGYDFTRFVRGAIGEVEETLIIAFLLVAFVIMAFLRDWRATLIPVIAIPVSLVATFFIMWLAGFTINILTLVGLVLAIGLVVDDAIVVLENVYTKIEAGQRPFRAAIEGTKEVYVAVIATTVVLAAVFVPVVFLEGVTGRLFRELGIVVAGSVLISCFVALTLSPMLCRFLLKRHTRQPWLHRVTEPFFEWMTRVYGILLSGSMKVRWIAPLMLVGLGWGTVELFKGLPQELAPLEDRSNIRLSVRAPEGATFEYTEAALDRLAVQVADRVPEISKTFSITAMWGGSVNTGVQNIYLVEPAERARPQADIFKQLAADFGDWDELRVFPAQPPTIGSRFGGLPVQFVLQAPSMEALLEVQPRFIEKASQRPELRFVDSNVKVTRPEGTVFIDRERANALGIPLATVARALQLSFGDARLGYFRMNGRQYQVLGQLARPSRNEPSDIGRVFLKSGAAHGGKAVPLDNLVTLREGVAPSAIPRYDRAIAATISAGLGPNATLGDAVRAMEEVAAEVLPDGFRTALAGEARDFRESGSSLLFAFAAAILLAFLVLAAQFESWIDPLIVLLTVPMSLVGGLAALELTGATLNVFSQIGLIMLVGLVTKNGILIVEFANQRKATGLTPLQAAIEGAKSRFRPVLMTALATILGVLPIALELGNAGGSRQSLGIAVVGGMVVGTFLSLYLVPALYALLSRRHRLSEEEEEAAAAHHGPAEEAARS